jgi:hypothetical protein
MFSHTVKTGTGGTSYVPLVDTDGHLQVDILSTTSDGAIVTLGTTTYSEASSKAAAIGGVRNDTLAALAGTDNEWAPFQVNSSGALYVETSVESGKIKSGAIASGAIASGAVASGAVASGAVASGAIASGAVADGAMVTLGAKADNKSSATDTTSITAMQVLKQISASVQETAADTGTMDSDTDAIKTATEATQAAVEKTLYGTALAVTAVDGGSNHSLGATYEAFYIGVGGDIKLDCITSGSDILFRNVASGQLLPVRAATVKASGTTATGIVALKA